MRDKQGELITARLYTLPQIGMRFAAANPLMESQYIFEPAFSA